MCIRDRCVSIRRFRRAGLRLDELARPAELELLSWAVHARANVLVTGAAGAGKTTLLNALACAIPSNERVVTIEDAAELALDAAHVVRLEARPPNSEGVGAVTVRDLVRNALRMRPDRIVVGEVRGPEVIDMLQAMETGHDGSFSTCHANGPLAALHRLESLVLATDMSMPVPVIRRHLASCIDFVVHLERTANGKRTIREICEVASFAPNTCELDVQVVVAVGEAVDSPRRQPRRSGTTPFAWSAP